MNGQSGKVDDKEKRFLKYHERLMAEIHLADAHFKLWKRLQGYIADYHKELNQAPFFFQFTIKAHLDAALMHIFKVIDIESRSLNIWRFLNFVEESKEIFSTKAFSQRMVDNIGYEVQVNSHKPITLEIIQEDRKKLKKLKTITKNLLTWRNKSIAHIDEQSLVNGIDVVKQYPVKIENLEEIITALFDIMNSYLQAYKSTTWSRVWIGEDDIKTVVDSIRFKIENRRQLRA